MSKADQKPQPATHDAAANNMTAGGSWKPPVRLGSSNTQNAYQWLEFQYAAQNCSCAALEGLLQQDLHTRERLQLTMKELLKYLGRPRHAVAAEFDQQSYRVLAKLRPCLLQAQMNFQTAISTGLQGTASEKPAACIFWQTALPVTHARSCNCQPVYSSRRG